MKAYWVLSGSGDMDIDLSEVDNLTKEGVEDWIEEGARIEVFEQGSYSMEIRFHCTDEEIEYELKEEAKERR